VLENIIDTGKVEVCHIDTYAEGESEKEITENLEDVIKIKFHNSNLDLKGNPIKSDDLVLNWVIIPPYLEIYSPPPEKT
jgi:hypothetical protein